MRSPRSALAVAVLVLGWWPEAHSSSTQTQDERPQFRSGVELVQLDVSVLDRDRRPVTGLTAADFTLFENGRRKPIRTFAAIQLPARVQSSESPGSAAVPSDVATNRGGDQDGRLVVILMDRSIPPEQPTIAAKKIATAAVEALGPNDLAAFVSTSGGVPQNLTANRARLIEAINQRDWSTGLSPEQEAIIGKQDPLSDGRCLCGLCVLETVTRIADAVQHAPRRHKMVLFIGTSLILQSGPRAPSADVGCERRLDDARQRMETSLARSHLTVHSIDPSGLIGPGIGRGGMPGGKPGEDRLKRVRQAQDDTAELLQQQGSLQFLPDLTGGRVVVNTNAPEAKVPDIFGESSAYYVLAFEPEKPGITDRDASIDVRVSRRGVHVYAQRRHQLRAVDSIAATKVATAAPGSLLTALRGLLPVATRPLAMAVAAFAGKAVRATVVVNVDVSALGTPDTSAPLEFAWSAVDPTGREIAFAKTAETIVFGADTAGGPLESNVQTTLELPPGDYEIRMAVANPGSSVVASVFSPLTVPRFETTPLSLSDAIVEATGRSASPAGPPLSATTRRSFDRQEQVRALFQIYPGTGRTEPITTVSVRSRIVTAGAASVVRHQQLDLTAKDFVNRIAGIAMDMSGLPAGSYVLITEATTDRLSTERRLPFTVR